MAARSFRSRAGLGGARAGTRADLAGALEESHLDRRLSVPWRVGLTLSDGDNADTTFSLAPSPAASCPVLATLQRGVDTIAGHLRDVVSDEARKTARNAGSGAGG